MRQIVVKTIQKIKLIYDNGWFIFFQYFGEFSQEKNNNYASNFYLHANVQKSSIISPKCKLKDASLSKDSSACQKKRRSVRELIFSFRTQLTLLYCAYI